MYDLRKTTRTLDKTCKMRCMESLRLESGERARKRREWDVDRIVERLGKTHAFAEIAKRSAKDWGINERN